MGRIKTQQVKRASLQVYREHKEMLKPDFTQNKEVLKQLADIKSKKLRNTIAGYLTRLVKSNKEL